MPDYRKMMNKTYLGHWDLPEDRDAHVTITRVEPVEISNGTKKDRRPAVFVAGKSGEELPKPFIGNATNCKTIATLYGNKTEDWIGKPISLYRANVQGVGGGMTDAIRVRPTAPTMEPKQ